MLPLFGTQANQTPLDLARGDAVPLLRAWSSRPSERWARMKARPGFLPVPAMDKLMEFVGALLCHCLQFLQRWYTRTPATDKRASGVLMFSPVSCQVLQP